MNLLAERVGFEPTVEFPLHTLSKRAPSTTRTSLRATCACSSRSLTAGRLSRIIRLTRPPETTQAVVIPRPPDAPAAPAPRPPPSPSLRPLFLLNTGTPCPSDPTA